MILVVLSHIIFTSDHTRSLDEAREFINSQKGTSDRLKRGPFLAELELELRIKDKENGRPFTSLVSIPSKFEGPARPHVILNSSPPDS